MTIDEAFELRGKLKALGRHNKLKLVLENILYGEYDKFKEEAREIAKEDLEFLTKDQFK